MSPEGFLEFRDPLAPASGFQSRQFRAIEWISGERDTWPGGGDPPAGPLALRGVLRRARSCRRIATSGSPRSPTLYRDHAGDPLRAAWHEVAELLLDHDEGIARWRHHHALMAAREIGTRPGTGGSPGVAVPARDRRPALLPGPLGRAAGALSAAPSAGRRRGTRADGAQRSPWRPGDSGERPAPVELPHIPGQVAQSPNSPPPDLESPRPPPFGASSPRSPGVKKLA